MTKEEKLKYCSGCEDNFYNGNNPYDVKECWGLEKARLMSRKKVSVNSPPPWNWSPSKYLSCYKQKGYVFFEGDRKVW